MKKSFHFEVPFEVVDTVITNFEPEDGVELLVTAFKQAFLYYVIIVAEEGGDIEDETCLS